ncbi:hypothetical protein RR48_13111 [Papilio machaon]|uniref:Uncharacterized protein n=1 Tax=Papilio machaon TaxID=76193 RepID=A0A194QSA8_PAPMA|nr:hypothetical protein RR48_13111 [Papilio machaon]
MGNTKSKKVKITQTGPVGAENENRERINSIKTDVSDVNAKRNVGDKEMDQMEEKQHDNASSASTVEVLDDK